jgi:hypothetical protein
LWRFVTGDLKFNSKVSFWCRNVFWFDHNLSSEAFSIVPDLNDDVTNTDFDIQMGKWFELFTPRQVTKAKFLEVFANYLLRKLLLRDGFIRLGFFL